MSFENAHFISVPKAGTPWAIPVSIHFDLHRGTVYYLHSPSPLYCVTLASRLYSFAPVRQHYQKGDEIVFLSESRFHAKSPTSSNFELIIFFSCLVENYFFFALVEFEFFSYTFAFKNHLHLTDTAKRYLLSVSISTHLQTCIQLSPHWLIFISHHPVAILVEWVDFDESFVSQPCSQSHLSAF